MSSMHPGEPLGSSGSDTSRQEEVEHSQTCTRRSFMKLLGTTTGMMSLPLVGASEAYSDTANAPRPEGENVPGQLPFRHIHLDFHTSPAITEVGDDFKADEFASILAGASVDSITVFAKCHHGMSYYPTKVGMTHPHLKFDLLGEMIEGCRRRGIFTVAYISTMYDQRMWTLHGDWRVLDENGDEAGLRGKMGPMKARLGTVCVNTPQLDYLAAQAEEVVKNYDVDGMFFDNYLYPAGGCSCAYCMLDREKLGLDSTLQADREKHSQMVLERGMKRLSQIVRQNKPQSSLFFNGPINFRSVGHIRRSLEYSSHIEIESLPGGAWGYSFFEVAARYLRNLGQETTGMTGRFWRSWGDFGTVRNQAALDYECFRMVAQATKCAIGDHLHPTGMLNKVVYERIGQTYRSVAKKEPWCRGATAVTEIGILTTASYASVRDIVVSSDLGATNMLEQLHHQFDVLDTESDFHRYPVLILPDSHRLDEPLLGKIQDYLARGGKLILSYESGLDKDGKQFALAEVGLECEGLWPHDYQYIEVADGPMNDGIPRMVHFCYEKGLAVKVRPGTKLVAHSWKAYFDRSYKHFQVEQTPWQSATDYAAVAQRGNIIYIAAPIFRMYAESAYVFYRQLVGNCIRQFLPAPLIRSAAPSTAQITVTAQPGRMIVHVMNYVPERRTPGLDVVEETSPLTNLKLSVRTGERPRRVYLVPEKTSLPFEHSGGFAHLVVPQVNGHQMVVLEA